IRPGAAKRRPRLRQDRDYCSNLYLDPDFDHLRGRDAEIGGGAFRVALHEGVERLAPYPHARNVLGRYDGFPTDIIGDPRELTAVELRLLVRIAHAFRHGRAL